MRDPQIKHRRKVHTFDGLQSKACTLAFVKKVSAQIASMSNNSITLSIADLLAKGKYEEVARMESTELVDPTERFYQAQLIALVSKSLFIGTADAREETALERFVQSERKCGQTNRRLRNPGALTGVEPVLLRVQRKIAWILGDVPSLDQLDLRFGPGASVGVKGALASPLAKLAMPCTYSSNTKPFLGDILSQVPLWCERLSADKWRRLCQAPGRLAFVPKNFKTHRSIMVEPTLNGFVQLGIGAYLKRRLKRVGLDLSDQSANQRMARQGSIDGSLATIDLSMASDTIAWSVVLNLLPIGWADFLCRYRTEFAVYDGVATDNPVVFALQKFSSMGNGFTFELESLIFFAVALACLEMHDITPVVCENVRVYGDDIIVPTCVVPVLKQVLDSLGFSLNDDKSFWEGPFRESCGADYLLGYDVRPWFLREQISDQALYVYHNFMIAKGHDELALIALSFLSLPPLFGPVAESDGHLHDVHFSGFKKKRCWGGCGVSYTTYVSVGASISQKLFPRWARRLAITYAAYRGSAGEGEPALFVVRGSSRYRKKSCYSSFRP